MVRVSILVAFAALAAAPAAAQRYPGPVALDRGLLASCPLDVGALGDCDAVALRPAPDRSGAPNGAFLFDGVRAYARVRVPVQSQRFTVAAWIRPDRVDRPQVIVSRIRNLPGHWQKNLELRLDPGGRLFLHVPSGNAWEGVSGQRALAPGRWTFVAATYDGARAQLWVDGVRDGAPLAAAYVQSDTEMLVGARPESGGADGRTPSGPTYFFAGTIADVLAWDRPLGDDELAMLARMPANAPPLVANAAAPIPPPAPPPLRGPPPVGPGAVTVAASYPLDGDATDVSGRAPKGVVHGARPAEDRLGNPTGALAFRKRDKDYVELGAAPEPERFTIAAWIRPTEDREMVIYSKYSSARRPPDRWLELRVVFPGAIELQLPSSFGRDKVTSSQRRIAANRWTHVTATFDGERAALYVDGQLDGEARLEGFDASPGPAFLGARPMANGKLHRAGPTFDGRMDEVVFLRGALAPAQVLALFQGAAPGQGPGPVAGHDEQDERRDLLRLDRLVAQFDAACVRRSTEALQAVEARVIDEIDGEVRDARSDRRDRERAQSLKRAGQEFQALRGRLDAVSIDRKREILGNLADAAWTALAEELDEDPWTRSAAQPQAAGWR